MTVYKSENDCVSCKQYRKYIQIAENILKEISIFCQIPKYKIRWKNFEELLKNKYGIKIVPYSQFSEKLNKVFAGSLLVISHKEVGIGINSNQLVDRQHFTIAHEGVHFMCDAQKGNKPQSFSDLISRKAYSSVEKVQEQTANYVSSLIICNDCALLKEIKKGNSVEDLKKEFEMTKSALWVRIFNCLYYNYNFSFDAAKRITTYYVYRKSNFLNIVINYLLQNEIVLEKS